MTKIAIAQMNPTLGDLLGNGQKIVRQIENAKKEGAEIIVFPEQVVTGYPAYDLLLHEDFVYDTLQINQWIAAKIQGITAIVGSVNAEKDGLHNVALVIKDGRIIETIGSQKEQDYFTPTKIISPININGARYGILLSDNGSAKGLVQQGADFILNLSASYYHINKKQERYEFLTQNAMMNHVPIIYVNMVGGQDELIFDGSSMMINHDGTLAYQLPQFEENLSVIDTANDTAKKRYLPLEQLIKEEQIFKALTLGLRDYIQKNKLSKAILGLSGGIDSALTAVIAKEALGANNVKGISMPSKFNSNHAYEDAKELASNLGIDFDVVGIGGMYDSIMQELKSKFNGKPFDVTEENIQARLRMMILFAHSNKHGYSVLCTGDKSEATVGYCTLYGDLAGGICAISDLTKPEIYAVSNWYNSTHGNIIPIRTLTKAPSPELKPNQVAPFDYGRLSPLLDGITNRESITELLKKGYSSNEIDAIYRKWKAAEFKRAQAPIGLRCKPISFGKGRNYPVTNNYLPFALSDR